MEFVLYYMSEDGRLSPYGFVTYLPAGGQPVIGFSRPVLVSPGSSPGGVLLGSFDAIEAALYGASGCVCSLLRGRHDRGH